MSQIIQDVDDSSELASSSFSTSEESRTIRGTSVSYFVENFQDDAPLPNVLPHPYNDSHLSETLLADDNSSDNARDEDRGHDKSYKPVSIERPRRSHEELDCTSLGTVSTEVLLNLNESTNEGLENVELDPNRSSLFLPFLKKNCDLHPNDLQQNQRKKDEEKSSSSDQYIDNLEPDIEEAVRLLKTEVANARPRVSYVNTSLTTGFEPHEYKLPKKASQSSLRVTVDSNPIGRTKAPHSPSLLSNILVPPPEDNGGKTIPALRAVSGSHHNPSRSQNKHSVTHPISIKQPDRARLARITKMTESQAELSLVTMKMYQRDMNSELRDLEATAGRGFDTLDSSMPIQHIDSSSIRSFDSKENHFLEIYSIPRILGTVFICMIIPPFFFMIASGESAGVSNYRLMRMIMNSNHRIGLMKGFVWDVNVTWFRVLCLTLGTLETLGILACVGSGIGVGIRNSR